MSIRKHLSIVGLLLLGMVAQPALAQEPMGWGVGVDASRLMGGHAVVHVEHAQQADWLWSVDLGRYVGPLTDSQPCWRDLRGEVKSGHLVTVGVKAFPAEEMKLGAKWFVGADATREQYSLANVESLVQLDNQAGLKQTREELRLLVGAQWEVGSHLAARVHVGMGVVRDRVTAWAQGEEINSLPIARPGGVELIWRW